MSRDLPPLPHWVTTPSLWFWSKSGKGLDHWIFILSRGYLLHFICFLFFGGRGGRGGRSFDECGKRLHLYIEHPSEREKVIRVKLTGSPRGTENRDKEEPSRFHLVDFSSILAAVFITVAVSFLRWCHCPLIVLSLILDECDLVSAVLVVPT